LARAVSIAGVQLGATVAVANWFIQKRGRAAAMGAFGQRFGQAVVPLMLLPLIIGLSWRSAYVALSISTLLFAALPAFLFLRRRPEDYGMLPDGASPDGYRSEPPSAREVARAAVDSTPWTVREAFRTRAFWLIVVTMATISFAQTATNLHAAASFQEKGISFAASATIVFVFAMTSAISTFPWGWLIDRLHIRYVMMASATLYSVSMFLIMNATTYLGAVAFGVVFGTAAGAWTLGFRLLIPNYFRSPIHRGDTGGYRANNRVHRPRRPHACRRHPRHHRRLRTCLRDLRGCVRPRLRSDGICKAAYAPLDGVRRVADQRLTNTAQ
jgi:sugar phosphate permease